MFAAVSHSRAISHPYLALRLLLRGQHRSGGTRGDALVLDPQRGLVLARAVLEVFLPVQLDLHL
jgi:hypothetical protein